MDYERIKGTRMATQMVIVLSKKQRTAKVILLDGFGFM
jgi:hypothetical protein